MLAIVTYPHVFVYRSDGTEFSKEQTISFGSSYFRRVSWTEDHQYMTLAGEGEYQAYVYNYTGGRYRLIENNGDFKKNYGR